MREKEKKRSPRERPWPWLAVLLAATSLLVAQGPAPGETGPGEPGPEEPGTEETAPKETAPGTPAGKGGERKKFGLDDAIDALQAVRCDRRSVRFDPPTNVVHGVATGHVVWRYQYRREPFVVQADHLVLTARLAEREAGGEAPPEDSGLRLGKLEDFTFYAQGNVRLELPGRATVLEADAFYHDSRSGFGIASGVRMRTLIGVARAAKTLLEAKDLSTLGGEFGPRPGELEGVERTTLFVQARLLRTYSFRYFHVEGVEASTCDYGVPHYSLSAPRAEIYPTGTDPAELRAGTTPPDGAEAPAAPAAVESPGAMEAGSGEAGVLQPQDFIIDPEETKLTLFDHRIAPLPVSHWDTRWQDQFPIRNIPLGHSSEFGSFVGIDWNLNYFLKLVPRPKYPPLDRFLEDAQAGFETTYLEKRGFGYGPRVDRYGESPTKWEPWQLQLNAWTHYGEGQYYAIEDHADEDRTTRQPVPREDRYWGHAWHRQSIPHVGLFDIEYSNLSDRAFLGEYFEQVAKEEKEQENLVYGRRNFRDNTAVTGLYLYRIDDFVTQTERMPEAKFFWLQEPVFRSGLYGDLKLQGAQLRPRPDEDLLPATETRDFERYDVLNEWSYPVSWFSPYLQARPFGLLRYTYYGEIDDPAEGAEDRATFGGGITVSQEWSRIYPLAPGSLARRLLRAPSLKHVIVPRVSYLNVAANDLEPEETIPVDATDVVDLEESVSFSLINSVLGRVPLKDAPRLPAGPRRVTPLLGQRCALLESQPFRTETFLESEVSFILYPQPGRDNDGDQFSLLRLDNTARLVEGFTLRALVDLDPNEDFHGERVASSLTCDIIPDRLTAGIGDRFSRDQSNTVSFFGRWKLGEKWFLEGYYARDFERGRDVEYKVVLGRVFHCFGASIQYVEDVGEDRNRTVMFNVAPVEMFKTRFGSVGKY